MTDYVITPQSGTPIIFGTLSAATDHEAGLSVLKAVTGDARLAEQIFFYGALTEACQDDTDIETADRLYGHGWFELAPTTPMPGGQPAGDHQDGDALAVRYALRRGDGLWAVVTRWACLAIPHGEPLDSELRVIEVHSEFVVCKDLHNVTGTETFGFDTVTGLPYEPTHANVRREANLLSLHDITWDGQEFEAGNTEGLLR